MVLWLFTKVFSAKFGSVASFAVAKESNPRKFFVFLTNSRKFSPLKVSRYTVYCTHWQKGRSR